MPITANSRLRALLRPLSAVLLVAALASGCRDDNGGDPPVIVPAREVEPAEETPLAPEVTAYTDRVIADFEEMDGWAFTTHPETVDGYLTQSFGDEPVHEGQFSAKLVYDFAGARDETAAAYAATASLLPLSWDELSIWVYGDGSGHWLRAEFVDSAGVKFVGDLARGIDWRGSWKECRLTQDSLVALREDGQRRHPPLALTRIYLVVLPDGAHDAGEVYLDTMTLQ